MNNLNTKTNDDDDASSYHIIDPKAFFQISNPFVTLTTIPAVKPLEEEEEEDPCNINKNNKTLLLIGGCHYPLTLNQKGVQITIASVCLTCDSPGAYYHGTNTYCNSAVCTGGDQAKLNVTHTCI